MKVKIAYSFRHRLSMSKSSSFFGSLNSDSVIKLLSKCCESNDVKRIKNIHGGLITTGLLFVSQNVIAKLAQSYATCVSENGIDAVWGLFKYMNPTNPVPFNAIVSDFCRKGMDLFALKAFCFMHGNGVALDSYALCSAVKCLRGVEGIGVGEQLHCLVWKLGWVSSVFVGSGLVDFYGKNGRVGDARKLFDEIPVKNVVCVNALLAAYGEVKLWVEVLELVKAVPKMDLVCDNFTLSASLRASAAISAVSIGKQLHGYALRSYCEMVTDVYLRSSLIEMYGKCGLVESALHIFDLAGMECVKNSCRDLVLWTSLIGVYGKNGFHEEVICLFNKMMQEGIRPDDIVLLTVISACGHTGQVERGVQYFNSMSNDSGLQPKLEHYNCLVDLLCRAGEVNKAWKLVCEMPNGLKNSNCSVQLWGALLSACLEHGYLDLGILSAQKAIELNPENFGLYLKLSSLYGKFEMWDEIDELRKFIQAKELVKSIGYSQVKH